jgi:hypothetical protein
MRHSSKNKKSTNHNIFINDSISIDVKNCNYSPAAIRKAEEAIKFLEKAGLPEELLKIRDAQYGKK